MAWQVRETRDARKVIEKAPQAIADKYDQWLDFVRNNGPYALNTRFPGFHDKPLKGALAGLRESRLSDRYRVLYEVDGSKSRPTTRFERRRGRTRWSIS